MENTTYASHVGQIVLLAKDFRSSAWTSLSVPRGKSKEFNEAVRRKQAGGGDAAQALK